MPSPGSLFQAQKNTLYVRNVLSSHGLHRSTFGDTELNYRVRNGIGCTLCSKVTHIQGIHLSNSASLGASYMLAPWRPNSGYTSIEK